MAQIIDPGNPLYPIAQGFDLWHALEPGGLSYPGEGWVHSVEAVGKGAAETAKSLALAVLFIADPQNWLRVAEALAGGILVLVGVLMLAKDTPAGQAVQRQAGTAAKVAALA